MITTEYVLKPLSAAAGDRLRVGGGITYVADSKPGYPCRQCMRDAEIGDTMLLVSYDPFVVDSPYRSASPIFIHQAPCAPQSDDELPAVLTIRQLSLRAFDTEAMMLDAAVVQGADLDDALQRMFANDDVAAVHVHNLARGCWATNVDRRREFARHC